VDRHAVCALSFGLLLLFLNISSAQAPDTFWTKTYGGSDGEIGESVRQTADGGYIIAGYTYSNNVFLNDIYLVKTDAGGTATWIREYGGDSVEWGHAIDITSDGDYIITGETWRRGRDRRDIYLIKINANGDSLWVEEYGGTRKEIGYSVQQTTDGGYIITGSTTTYGPNTPDYSNIYLVKTDVVGGVDWTQVYGGTYNDFGSSVKQTSDGGYIVAGQTYSDVSLYIDLWLLKTDANGDTIWAKLYGGTSSDGARSVQQTLDGGYIIAGYTSSFGAGQLDMWLLRTDANGDTMWARTFGGASNDFALSVDTTADGGYIVAGYTYSFGAGDQDFYIVKTNADGDMLWSKTVGSSGAERAVSIQQTSDSGYIITGYNWSITKDYDVYLVKLEPDLVGVYERDMLAPCAELTIEPNPFREKTKIRYMIHDTGCTMQDFSIKIYDVNGRLVYDFPRTTLDLSRSLQQRDALHSTVTWDGTDRANRPLPSGVYFVRLKINNYKETRQVLFIK